MIQIEKLNKSYKIGNGTYPVLRDLSLTVEDGEMVAIKGRSGAGKTTLLNIIGGIDGFDSGRVMVNGRDLFNLDDVQMAKYRCQEVGFVLQDFSLISQKSVLFNVMLPMYFDKTPMKEMKTLAMSAITRVGIADQAKKKAALLSGGQRQRAAIARAIVRDTGILLADEPTGNLDSSTADEIMQLLLALNKEGKTILIVTHDDQVASFCHRVVTIADGVIG